jgi:hypothetical protein
MADKETFDSVFAKLKPILQKYERGKLVKHDKPGNYYLDLPFSEKYYKEICFGAVQIKKRYVSFHLMPVYMFPELLEGISDKLRKRMQGKSCFNFTTSDDQLFAELSGLVQRSAERCRKEQLVLA